MQKIIPLTVNERTHHGQTFQPLESQCRRLPKSGHTTVTWLGWHKMYPPGTLMHLMQESVAFAHCQAMYCYLGMTSYWPGMAATQSIHQDTQFPEAMAQETFEVVLNQQERLLSRQQAEVGETDYLACKANIVPALDNYVYLNIKQLFYFCEPIHTFLMSVMASSTCLLPKGIRIL